jgi:hypothetical protein
MEAVFTAEMTYGEKLVPFLKAHFDHSQLHNDTGSGRLSAVRSSSRQIPECASEPEVVFTGRGLKWTYAVVNARCHRRMLSDNGIIRAIDSRVCLTAFPNPTPSLGPHALFPGQSMTCTAAKSEPRRGLVSTARARGWSTCAALLASVVEFGVRAIAVVVIVEMIVMVDFALFGPGEIWPGREPLIDCHSWCYRQSRHRGAEQCRAHYRGYFDGHHTGLLMPHACW